jgi:hypothetical protein
MSKILCQILKQAIPQVGLPQGEQKCGTTDVTKNKLEKEV